MASRDEGFLPRWSRRKRASRDRAKEQLNPNQATAAPEEPAPGAEAGAETEAEIEARLPDIDTLDDTSDFTVFLKEGVPEALRRKALRRLWRLNPVFANLDGLNDYDEDFTDAATVVAGMKTLYQVGKGIVAPEEEEEKKPAPEEEKPVAEEPVAEAKEPVGEVEEPVAGSDPAADGAPPDDPAPAPPPPQTVAEASPATAGPDDTPASAGPGAVSATDPAPRRGARERRWGRRSS